MTKNEENDELLRAERKVVNARVKARRNQPKKTEAELRAFIFGTPVENVEGK